MPRQGIRTAQPDRPLDQLAAAALAAEQLLLALLAEEDGAPRRLGADAGAAETYVRAAIGSART